MVMQKEMPIFVRTFDFMQWILPVTNHFPKTQRHIFTKRLLDAVFDLRERLEEANYRKGSARLERIMRADECLSKIRMYIRLAYKFNWLSANQYRHVSKMITEIGRLLGGWKKVTQR
jgi:four helix bundle protein